MIYETSLLNDICFGRYYDGNEMIEIAASCIVVYFYERRQTQNSKKEEEMFAENIVIGERVSKVQSASH